MREIVETIVSEGNSFRFERDDSMRAPQRYLSQITQNVPNEEGNFIVFSTKILNPSLLHLHFMLDGQKVELVDFGKAGGVRPNGKPIRQGIYGRINNVVSDSAREIKDMNRGTYWSLVMQPNDLDIPTLLVYYQEFNGAAARKREYLAYLNRNNLAHPKFRVR